MSGERSDPRIKPPKSTSFILRTINHSFQATACTLANQVNQILQLTFIWRLDALKPRSTVITIDVHAIQEKDMKMNVEVQGGAEALYQCHRPGGPLPEREPGLVDQMGRDRPIHDAQHRRLSLTRGGNVRYALKTLYRDGTTHVIFEPEDFIARLVALVPKPRAHLTRYHGVFAPASPDRAQVVPRIHAAAATERGEVSATDRQRAMSWAQRLKRVFAIDIETCRQCGGRLRVIASIEEPAVIEQILEHLGRDAGSAGWRPRSAVIDRHRSDFRSLQRLRSGIMPPYTYYPLMLEEYK